MSKNIIVAGVGGQGLVLMTRIISQAAFNEKYDVKTNDVIGLSQRGGMVWGNIKYGKEVFSPNIYYGKADIIVSLEPLEALRWSEMLKSDGIVITNDSKVYPTIVQQEKEMYPDEEILEMSKKFKTIKLNSRKEALELGKPQVENTILIGVLAKFCEFSQNSWIEAIRMNVKPDFFKLNIEAFEKGQNLL